MCVCVCVCVCCSVLFLSAAVCAFGVIVRDSVENVYLRVFICQNVSCLRVFMYVCVCVCVCVCVDECVCG